jgi:hypothetical protein
LRVLLRYSLRGACLAAEHLQPPLVLVHQRCGHARSAGPAGRRLRATLPAELPEEVGAQCAQSLVLRGELFRELTERELTARQLGIAEVQGVVPAVEFALTEGRHCGASSVVGRGNLRRSSEIVDRAARRVHPSNRATFAKWKQLERKAAVRSEDDMEDVR